MFYFSLIFLIFSCSNDNLMDSGSKKDCGDLFNEKIAELVNLPAKISVIYGGPPDMGLIISDEAHIIYAKHSESATLFFFNSEGVEHRYTICNLPNSIKKMDISSEEKEVILSGNIYSSKAPESEDARLYLELTSLKKK